LNQEYNLIGAYARVVWGPYNICRGLKVSEFTTYLS